MSAIIDDKVVAGVKSLNTVKEDPIVALTVRTFLICSSYILLHNIIIFLFFFSFYSPGKSKVPLFLSGSLF